MEEFIEVLHLLEQKHAQIGTLCLDLALCQIAYAEDMALLFDYSKKILLTGTEFVAYSVSFLLIISFISLSFMFYR